MAAQRQCILCAFPLAVPSPRPPYSAAPHRSTPVCSEPPQPRVTDLFGLGSLLGSSAGSGGSSAAEGGSGSGLMERLMSGTAGEEAYYAAARSAIEAAMDEAEQRALWARFKVG